MEGATKLDPRGAALRAHAAGDDPRRHLSDPQLRCCTCRWRSVRSGALGVGLGRRRARGRGAGGAVAAWAVFRTARRRDARGHARRPAEAEEAGLRAALAWLAFPPLMITASTGTTDVVLAAMLAGRGAAVAPPGRAAAAMLAMAGWFKLAPFALCRCAWRRSAVAGWPARLARSRPCRLPCSRWCSCWVGFTGPGTWLHAVAYQFTRGSVQSIWAALGIERRPADRAGCGARTDRRGDGEAAAGAGARLRSARGWQRCRLRS